MCATIGSTAPALASLRRCRALYRSSSATAANQDHLSSTAYAKRRMTNLSKYNVEYSNLCKWQLVHSLIRGSFVRLFHLVTSFFPSSFNGQAVSILNLASHSLPLLTAVRKEAGSDDRRPVRMLAYPVSTLPHSPLAARRLTALTLPLHSHSVTSKLGSVQAKGALTKLHRRRRSLHPLRFPASPSPSAALPFSCKSEVWLRGHLPVNITTFLPAFSRFIG